MNLSEKIQTLKKEKDVTILAHYYQPLDVQNIADYIGDSLGLAKYAKDQIHTKYILFAAVKFMAETASILNQEKIVLSPDLSAGCPLSNFINPQVIQEAREKYPGSPLIVYVNTTAETKAYADVCCTSSNAVSITKKVAEKWNQTTILFGPDKNLAAWVKEKTNLNIIPVPPHGNCLVHNTFTEENVNQAKKKYLGAKFIVHPEAPKEILMLADFVGSTSEMIIYVKTTNSENGYIIGTEIGLIDYLKVHLPGKKVFPLTEKAICKNMKKISLEKIYTTLTTIGTEKEKEFEVRVPGEISQRAIKSIDEMINLSE